MSCDARFFNKCAEFTMNSDHASALLLNAYDDDHESPPLRRRFPYLEDSLAVLLGIEPLIRSRILSDGSPCCGVCGGAAHHDLASDLIPETSDDIFLAALPALEFGDLTEWAPLFEAIGIQFAISGEKLIRVDELSECAGVHPIAFLSLGESLAIFRERVQEWLKAHQGTLILFRMSDRAAPALRLKAITAGAVCNSCCSEIPPIEPGDLEQVKNSGCEECRGIGWQKSIGGFESMKVCNVCGGSGLPLRIANGAMDGCRIGTLPSVSFDTIQNLCGWKNSSVINALRDGGFSDYPSGFRYAWLSSGERARLQVLCLILSKVSGLTLKMCPGDLFDPMIGTIAKDFATQDNALFNTDSEFQISNKYLPSSPPESAARVALRGVTVGSYVNFNVEFPVDRLSIVIGASGTGKTLLLRDVLYSAFAKRRKMSHFASFPGISACVYISGSLPVKPRSAVGKLLGGSRVIADLFSSLRESRLKGFSVESFEGRRIDHQCAVCEGSGRNSVNDLCEVCRGTGLSPILDAVSFSGSTISEVLTKQLKDLVRLDWLPKGLGSVVASAVKAGNGDLSFSTFVDSVNPSTGSFLAALGQFSGVFRREDRVGVNRGTRTGTLILTDGVFLRSPSSSHAALRTLFDELGEKGHVVICAERVVPPELQSMGPHVLELKLVPAPSDTAGCRRPLQTIAS